MRRLEPPYPSFTLVMSKAQDFDVSRPSAYRAGFPERFRPYARISKRQPPEILMVRVIIGFCTTPRLARYKITDTACPEGRKKGEGFARPIVLESSGLPASSARRNSRLRPGNGTRTFH